MKLNFVFCKLLILDNLKLTLILIFKLYKNIKAKFYNYWELFSFRKTSQVFKY